MSNARFTVGSAVPVSICLAALLALTSHAAGAGPGDPDPSPRLRAIHAAPARTSASCDSPGDALWWDGFALPVQNGEVWALTDFGGDLIVGGTFTQAGYARANHVARWDGSQWSTLGDGVPSFVTGFGTWNGRLIAGCFQDGGDPKPLVYEFDGTSWNPLGTMSSQYSGAVRSFAVYNGDLVAAGTFEQADGQSITNLARWDGVTWQPLGSSPAGYISGIVTYGGKLIVAGSFQPFDNIAQWDGTSWSGLGAGFPGGSVEGLTTDGVNVYAGGYGVQIPGQPQNAGAVRWNGTSWSRVGSSGGTATEMTMYNGSLVAVGLGTKLARWTGTTWLSLADSCSSTPRAMHAWGSKLVIADDFESVQKKVTNDIAIYDGTSWTPLFQAWSPGMAGLWNFPYSAVTWNGSLVVAQRTVLTYPRGPRGGDQTDWVMTSGVSAWDGTHWSSIGPPGMSQGFVFSVANWQGSLVAGGSFTFFGTSTVRNITRWNGSGWESLAGGLSKQTPGAYVTSMVTYGNDLIAVGQFTKAYVAGTILNGVGRWDGVAWYPLGSGFNVATDVDRPYAGIANGSDLYVAGRFPAAGGVPTSNVARWDGSTWNALGQGVDDFVYTLAMFEGDLVAGGDFTHAGGVAAAGVARWNGTSWSPMGDNAIEIQVLRVVDGRLFAAGEFLCDDDSEVPSLAMWDGVTWKLLGSGFGPGFFTFIEPKDGDLYVGGSFGWANGHASFGIARWQGLSLLGAPASRSMELALAAPRPNPSTQDVEITYALPAAGRVTISVFDVTGRRVARLVDGHRAAGRQVARWSGRDAGGNACRAGLYLVRLETPFGVRGARVVRIP